MRLFAAAISFVVGISGAYAQGSPEPEPQPYPGPVAEPANPDLATTDVEAPVADTAATEYGAADPGVPAVVEEEAAPPRPPIVMTGSFFSRYELRDNYLDLGRTAPRFTEFDGVAYRARIGLATGPFEVSHGYGVSIFFQPQASGFWADAATTMTDGALGVHQATIRIGRDARWLDVGRFEMVYGEHLILGNVDWHETGRSFDGLRAHEPLGDSGAYLDFFLTQIAEGRPMFVDPPGAGDHYFTGLYSGLGPLVAEALDLDVYALFQIWQETDDSMPPLDNALEATLGARAKKRVGNLDFRAETGLQVGENSARVDTLAYHFDAEVGAHVYEDRIRFGLLGFYASGDDPTTTDNEGWNQLYPTAHKFLGFADIMGGRSNATGLTGRLKAKLHKNVIAAADGHFFWRPETGAGVDNFTGGEIDLWLVGKLGDGLSLRGDYAAFLPNSSGPFGTGTAAHFFSAQLRYDLK